MKHKICCRCKKKVPQTKEYFYGDKYKSIGLRAECIECSKKDSKGRSRSSYYRSKTGRYIRTRCNAKTRGINFTLSFEDFLGLWGKSCSYCKKPIEFTGIDRIDFKKGYTKENVVSCCKQCNTIKGRLEWAMETQGKEKFKSIFRTLYLL